MIWDLLAPLQYAETHYKFKLPWSRLYKPWPEIFLDAPCRLDPGQKLPLVLVLRDANLFPVHIQSIELIINAPGWPTDQETILVDQDFDQAFHFVPIPFSLDGKKGQVTIQAQIQVYPKGKPNKSIFIQNWNYPTIASVPLGVHVLEHPTPKPSGWWAGETHCHTWHSSDPVEFGAPPWLLQQAAQALALDFVLCTDHSYDFEYRPDNYRIPANSLERWNDLLQDIHTLPPYPLMIPGEEVSCGNHRKENVHLLVAGYGKHLRGQGDSGRTWFKNHPDQSIPEILNQVEYTPCFAAHPRYPSSKLERFIFRRGDYHIEDLGLQSSNPLVGLEFWNGTQDRGFVMGRAFWIQQLLSGNPLLPIGGNDAHGDLNRFTGVHTPLWSLRSNRARLFGRTRTVFQSQNPLLNLTHLHQAIRHAQKHGSAYCTDGPALWWELGANGPVVHAKSSPDFGTIEEITLYRGYDPKTGEKSERLTIGRHDWQKAIDLQGALYVRAECRSRLGYRALTAAIWSNLF